MKKIILLVLLLGNIVSCFAQTLSGEYRNDGKSTGSYYTKINWSVSYRFEERNGNFYIRFYNPKISVPNYALYHDEFHKEYSLADLNLARWPNARQIPFAMQVKFNVSDGYNNYEMTAGCDADFTCGESYIVSKANVKNVTMQNFRVTSVTYFMANLSGEPEVDEILKSKRKSAGRPIQNKTANSSSDHETSSSETSSENSSGEESSSSGNLTIHNNVFVAEAVRKYNEQKMITDASKLIGDLFDNWQANREKKWAKEKQEEENHKERINRDLDAYSSFVSKQTNSIFKNSSTYVSMIKSMLPKVLASRSITWEDIIGAPDYNTLFGKDIKSVSRKLKIILPKDKSKSGIENVPVDYLPKHFTHQNFYYADANQTFFYWVKTDFYEHACSYIFDSNDVLIGIKIELHTSSQADKAFPSSLQEYISIKDYYEDLIKNTKGGYFLADGKTLITRDKVFILDFKSLTIYDLNFFDANTSFNLPGGFSQFFNSQNCNNCNSTLGVKFQGFRVDETKKLVKLRITEVDKNSAADKAGLLPGDVILKINDVAIDFPFHLQWYFLAFSDEKNINLKIERDKKTENISLTL